jgi:hypothetical protein
VLTLDTLGSFSLFPIHGWPAGEKSAMMASGAYKLDLIPKDLEDLAFSYFSYFIGILAAH